MWMNNVQHNIFPFLSVEYCKHHFYFYLTLFKYRFKFLKLPERLINDSALCAENEKLIKNLPLESVNDERAILFVANNLQTVGGVERRLDYLSKGLLQTGFRVYVLTEAGENFYQMSHKTVRSLELKFNASNFSKSLDAVIRELKIDIVEFQCKNVRYLNDLDLEKLQSLAVCGCTVHFKGNLPWRRICELDYRIFISERLQAWYGKTPGSEIICNGAEPLPLIWSYKKQKKALYIARLGRKQLPKMCQFIEFCRKNSLEFDIAGAGRDTAYLEKMKLEISRRYNISPDRFIGEIKTAQFLLQHASEYLFAAGVGQVIIESAMCGIPVFVLSDADLADATFVAPENYAVFRHRNFTIDRQPEILRTQDLSRVNEYASCREQILQDRDVRNVAARYVDFISGKIR